MQDGQEHQRQHQLQRKFLLGGQALIFRLANLGAVINKADESVTQRQQQYGKRLNRNRTHKNDVGENCHKRNADDEHKAAHGRRVLFAGMLRHIGQDFLSEIHIV